ncbi:N-acetyltransferase [Lentzea sp. NBRC 105346]|uniref:GNAT family N-acetyltransferase n=1 Tax=Lentzea sp. NBRC 105346 TaxID=3032205 RepID=UPI0024A1E100|nr:GNAT family N-acetyltransferase [Lentzea sp. NBRC 105346]GLZ33699.1 N-acetyltransferase [Lentzea sp. NBRC 105346]
MIVDNPEKTRFEAWEDDELVGFLDYRKVGDKTVLVHTESLVEGKGIGSRLAKHALDTLDDVVVQCPFIKKYLERHPEYRVTVE